MVDYDSQYHNELIIDQFTKQAIPFTQNAAHSAEYAVKRLVTLSNASKKDTVLDVACGSGLVSCELAKVADRITGIDITPAMIEQANLLKRQKDLNNIKYEIGDVAHLPFADASFSLVVTRYSFHHVVDPYSVLSEMKRVCMRKGRVVVIDVTPASDKVDMYDYVEKLRDPSHVKALTFAKLREIFEEIGLTIINTDFFRIEMDVERLLLASFPNSEDINKIRQLFIEDVQNNILGVNSHYVGTEIHFTFPTSMIIAQKS
ncbi:MAG: methyltransferase type 11 [Candidatus Nitrosopolaris wilkensis]|nr:MAG: methyltransferase type 11 [Candidatus Nitrosopolaris wilkensis]